MKRRKAMHYLRKMVKNSAIAYMLTYNEPNTNLRRSAICMYYKYRRFMKADFIMIPILDPDPDRPAKESTVNAIVFDKLTTKNPVIMKVYNMYPSNVCTIADKVSEDRGKEVNISFTAQGIPAGLYAEKAASLSKMVHEWIKGIV